MSRRTAGRLAWSLCGVVLALSVASNVFLIMADLAEGEALVVSIVGLIDLLAFASVGAVVASRVPENPIGWLFLAAPLLAGTAFATGHYIELAVDRGLPGEVPIAVAASEWIWAVFVLALGLLVILFPDGRFPSPRWRPIRLFVGLALPALVVLFVLRPGQLFLTTATDSNPLARVDNPVGVSGLDVAGDAFFLLTGIAVFVLALASQAYRYRNVPSQRQQIKWLFAAAAFVGAAELANPVLPDTLSQIAYVTIPVAVGVAILRYRLYDIDVVINRTLVYGSLTAALAGLYFGIVLLLQLAFSPLTEDNALAIAGSTLAVAALFRPARNRIQALVDRRFYRRKYDAQRTLESFSARLREEIDLDALRAELTGVVRETMQPAHVSLWLRVPEARP